MISLSNLLRFKNKNDIRYALTNHNHDDIHCTKDIANSKLSNLRNELLEIIYNYHPKILTLEINDTASTIDLTKCLKSWKKIVFNGELVDTIPSNTNGVIEIHNAIALDVYDGGENCFNSAVPSLISFSGDIYTSSNTSMFGMFKACQFLTSLDLSSFDTINVTDMRSMFFNCNTLTSLDLSNFDTSNVTDMVYMFSYCNALTSLDVSSFNTSNVTNMGNMFYECWDLTSLDLSSFDTRNVTDMGAMFFNCNTLTSLDLSSFNTSNVTNMGNMFYDCYALTSLNVSNFDTSNVTNMSYMFYDCSALTDIELSGDNVTLNTVQKISEEVTELTQMKNIYVADESKFEGLSYPNISYVVTIKNKIAHLVQSNITYNDDYIDNGFDIFEDKIVSKVITDNQVTASRIILDTEDKSNYTIEIEASVSSENGWDFLVVCAKTSEFPDASWDAGSDNILKISGSVNRMKYTKTFTSSYKYLEFRYRKDGSSSSGTDNGTIHSIKITAN